MITPDTDSAPSLAALYLKRINFIGDCAPTLANLQKLQFLHATHIPFGNTASFLGQAVPLDLEYLQHKLLVQNREGYCFEQSLLIQQALTELGYHAVNRLGRVYFMATPSETPAQSHLVTIVQVDGEDYLYDPNFGGMSPTAPLSLNRIGQTQQTPHEPYRFIPVNESGLAPQTLTGMHYMLQAYVLEEWINLYAFNPTQPVAANDVKVANWYISTSPESLFTQHLIMAIATPDARINLMDNTVKIHNREGTTQRVLETVEDFARFFEQRLKIVRGRVDYEVLVGKTKQVTATARSED
ncbi:arylamine N-acetyltransferase family protein [Pseudomonas sp. 5P_3.1_Bac2]|uniref:arylamine N-acetyltransferase family protein n=1 Tax=Pseudomonas sp. 5P_3.1_Bac2 TaxID=2971617 RepID=UPI0021CA2ABC|nr:arylamine N-acetyltransferase [Pseudomonas sp. 5P_3.1_Bac2]MCU1718614.1 arylamine N-acetyltransferase [Pseudomonas sp. 5P_3.1_Bac2]